MEKITIAMEQIYLAEETSKNLTFKAKVLVTTEQTTKCSKSQTERQHDCL